MIDPLGAFVGMFVGICIGFIIGRMMSLSIIEQLKYENERLDRDYRRVSTRDHNGKFTKVRE